MTQYRISSPWNYKNFSIAEMRCRCGECDGLPTRNFMEKLQALRSTAGFPFRVNSGYRCERYNKAIGGGPTHPKGIAVDIGVAGKEAYTIISYAPMFGFTGIGISQRGKYGGRFIHLDIADNAIIKGIYRPTIWSY